MQCLLTIGAAEHLAFVSGARAFARSADCYPHGWWFRAATLDGSPSP
jgi:hypothetical protein